MKTLEFLRKLVSINGQPSSKRFLAFVFAIVLIIAIFTGFPPEVLYTITGLITVLLGITGFEKFAKNSENNEIG